jgi:hypothetical protein
MDIVMILVFLGLVGWFLVGPNPARSEAPRGVDVEPTSVQPEPVRVAQDEHPVTVIAGYEMRCSDCHSLFETKEDPTRTLGQHQHVVLDHGLNNRCLNCHDPVDRNRLSLRGGGSVSFAEVDRLCAQCHGPTWRDWQLGMHGMSLGHWDASFGERRKLRCSECHDPHAPAFAPMSPYPPPTPHTLDHPRRDHGEAVEAVDPLRKWHSATQEHGGHE